MRCTCFTHSELKTNFSGEIYPGVASVRVLTEELYILRIHRLMFLHLLSLCEVNFAALFANEFHRYFSSLSRLRYSYFVPLWQCLPKRVIAV